MAERLRWGVLGASSRMYRGRILGPLEASGRHVVVAEASRDALWENDRASRGTHSRGRISEHKPIY